MDRDQPALAEEAESLTLVFDPSRTTVTSPELLRCLTEACLATPLTAEERVQLDALRAIRDGVPARLQALRDAKAEWEPCEYESGEWDDDDDIRALREEGFVLTEIIDALSGSERLS